MSELNMHQKVFLHTLKQVENTGRCAHRKTARQVTMLLVAAGEVGCPLRLFPGDAKITGKVFHRERKRVLKWVKTERPDLEAAYRAEKQAQSAQSASSPQPATTHLMESLTQETEPSQA